MEEITILRILGAKDFNYIEEINLNNKEEKPNEDKNESKFHDGRLMIYDSNKFGFIDENGKKIVDLKYDYAENFKDGVAKVGRETKHGFRHGLIDLFGKEIIKLKYRNISEFVDGIAIATTERGKFIAFNIDGDRITKKEYDYISPFKDGVAIVEKNKKYGLINKDGEEVTSLIYDNVKPFENGFSQVKIDDDTQYGKNGIIDKEGNEIVPIAHKSVTKLQENRFVCEGWNNGIFIYNEKGQVVNVVNYDVVEKYEDGYAKVWKRSKYGLIDINGIEIIEPKYSSLCKIFKGLYVVGEKGQFGIINNEGKIIVNPIYDTILGANEEYIIVGKENKHGLITHDGKLVTDIVYRNIEFIDNYIIFNTRSFSFVFDRTSENLILRTGDVSFDIVIKYQDKKIVKKFDTLEERDLYYLVLKEEVENENMKYKNRRTEIEKKLIEEETRDFDLFKEKVKKYKSEVM